MNKHRLFALALILIAGAAFAQTGNVDTTGSGTSGVYIETTSTSFPDVGVEVIDSLRVFDSTSAELLRLHADGKIGIGISAPAERFHLFDNADRGSLIVVENPSSGLSALAGFRAKADAAYGSFHAHASTRTVTRYNQTLGGWMELLAALGNGLAIGTLPDAPIVFGTFNAERMRIVGNGDVGIGTKTPAEKLHVFEDLDTQSFILVDNPNQGLSAAAMVRAKAHGALANFSTHALARTVTRFGTPLGGWTEILAVSGNGIAVGTLNAAPLILGTGNADRLHITPAGNVGINKPSPSATLHVGGNVIVDGALTGGSIQAQYQDVAEWVISAEQLAAGTVVIVAPGKSDEVVASKQAYDTRVAGVISPQPGLLLGVPGEAKVKVATTGRVRVRVDATAHPIEAGDILVSSARPGVAMKSIPIDVAGVKLHRPGTVVGKALQSLASGEGEILVLLSLQ